MRDLPTNVKVIIGLVALIVIAVVGFVAVTKMGSQTSTTQLQQTQQTTTIVSPSPATEVSPVFNMLSTWLPTATWSAPTKTSDNSTYGQLTGTLAKGEVKGPNPQISRNFENADYLKNLGYVEDINLAADGPGASNWGYKRVVNGKTEIIQFGYSTNRLLGPENNSAPFANVSVFVSDPFVK